MGDEVTALRGAVALVAAVLVGASVVGPYLPPRLQVLERAVCTAVTGVALTALYALLLADLRILYGSTLALALIATALVAASRRRPRLHLRWPQPGELVLLGLVAAFLAVSLPPFPYVLGGRDSGVYALEGVRLVRTHATAYHDPRLAALPTDVRPYLTVPHRWPGFQTDPLGTNRVVSIGYQLYPSVLAAAQLAAGSRTGLWALPVLSSLLILSLALLARRLVGEPFGDVAAVVTALLLVTSVVVSWFARYPLSETTTALMFFGGMLLFAIALEEESVPLAVVAAIVVGAGYYARVDAVLTLAAALPVVGWILAVRRRAGRVAISFFATATVLFAGSVVHARAFARFSADAILNVFEASTSRVAIAGAGLAFGIGAVVVLYLLGPRIAAVIEAHAARIGRALAALTALVAVAYALVAWKGNFQGARWVTWYTTRVGTALAVVGVVALLHVAWRRDRLTTAGIVVGVFLLNVFAYGDTPGAAPDQFWGVRRLYLDVLPTLALATGVLAVVVLRQRGLVRLAAGAVVLVALGWTVAYQVRLLRPLVSHVEYAGVYATLGRIEQAVGSRSNVVILGPHEFARNRFGTALDVLDGQNAYPVGADLAQPPPTAWIAGQVARGPVYVANWNGDLPPLDLDRLRYEIHAVIPIDLPVYDITLGTPPRHAGRAAGTLVVAQVIPAAAAPAQERRPSLALASAPTALLAGFSAVASDGATAYRTTGGDGWVVLPGMGCARSATITLGSPAGAARTPLAILVGGRVAGTVAPPADGRFAASRVKLPPSAGRDLVLRLAPAVPLTAATAAGVAVSRVAAAC